MEMARKLAAGKLAGNSAQSRIFRSRRRFEWLRLGKFGSEPNLPGPVLRIAVLTLRG
jgi:hypothetical protein